ncbi:hypothetical protein AX16_008740 [Volvariella volvacea WC 439]|nr:hypothetical protein AX16_008740 [Volvariella volvacea WC 439]
MADGGSVNISTQSPSTGLATGATTRRRAVATRRARITATEGGAGGAVSRTRARAPRAAAGSTPATPAWASGDRHYNWDYNTEAGQAQRNNGRLSPRLETGHWFDDLDEDSFDSKTVTPGPVRGRAVALWWRVYNLVFWVAVIEVCLAACSIFLEAVGLMHRSQR